MPGFDHYAVDVPVLETERLRLRGHRLTDFSNCAAMWADPAVTRHIHNRPFTEEESWTRLLRYVGHWLLMGFGYWLVEEKQTGHFLGEIGFADYQRDMRPSLKGIPEIGWVLAAGAHGRGYATEAVQCAVFWADSNFGSRNTACIIAPDNSASIRVAEKCGYQPVRQSASYKGEPVLLFMREPATKPA